MPNVPDFWRGGNFFREMNQMQRLMDRFFEEPSLRSRTAGEPSLWSPTCELSEDKEFYTAKFEIPGVSKDQIKVELHDNQLTVRAERKTEKKEEKKHYSEFSYGSYMRSFTLPTPVTDEKVNAVYENGILTVTMAKTSPNGARQIAVK
jgi:HSP20 family protein